MPSVVDNDDTIIDLPGSKVAVVSGEMVPTQIPKVADTLDMTLSIRSMDLDQA